MVNKRRRLGSLELTRLKGGVELFGILNVTPDSFSDGGKYAQPLAAVRYAEMLFEAGAAYIDIGAEATNPRAKPLEPIEEWQRLRPVLRQLLPRHPGRISVDSYHPETIEQVANEFGANFIVNDVTGMNNPIMRLVVARFGLKCIVSHLPAKYGIDIMRAHREADADDEQQVLRELLIRRNQLVELGLPKEKIILDPGIGFGKTPELNRRLLTFGRLIRDSPIMIGYSRKRFLGEHRMNLQPNLDAADKAIANGARYLRVHDVAGHYHHLVNN